MPKNLPDDLAVPERIVPISYALSAVLRSASDPSAEPRGGRVQVLAVGWGPERSQGAIRVAPAPTYLVFDRLAPEGVYWVSGDYVERLEHAAN